jgi:glycosyltransferase involved in cell wall biosynthesis
MKISIITVCCNSEATIEDTILSVLSQSYDNIEYILVDGASSDATLSIIKRYSRKISHIISEPDNGTYDAMNKGISIASGDVIGILNSDDIYYKETVLEKVVSAFADPEVDACFADLVYVDKDNTSRIIRTWKSAKYYEGLFQTGWIPPHPTFYVRKHVYERYGLFDPGYVLAADYEIMTRFMARHKIKTVYIPEILIKMRIGGTTNKSISNIVKQNMEIYRAAKKNGIELSLFFLFHKLYNRSMQFLLPREIP